MIFHDMRFDQLEQHSLFRFSAERRLAGAAPRFPPRGSLRALFLLPAAVFAFAVVHGFHVDYSDRGPTFTHLGSNTFDFLSLRSWIGIMSHHEQGTTAETPAWSSDSTESPIRDLTGTTLGDFEVKRLLGRGGMGQVYLATQISLNRPVALKVLHPRYLSKPIYLSRFEAEATAVAKLNHPNIVHVYTLGYVDPVRFIAMEYVEGTNLREYINKKGALDLPLALSIMRQAGQAIGAAGEVGLVHRDIKPENLLLTRKGRAKVADFGLCRDLGADRLHVTQPGTTMGTPLYMSPEQAQGKPLDHRSDLYSLGVTFYHMLSGEPPFRADSAVALALKHVSEQPVSLRVRRPDIPLELERSGAQADGQEPGGPLPVGSRDAGRSGQDPGLAAANSGLDRR